MLLSSSIRKYPTFPLLSYFSVVVCLMCLLHHILLLIACTFGENREFIFIIIVQFMMSANSRIRFGLKIVFVYLYITPSHYHHYANLSDDIELIKCLSDIFCRVCECDKAYALSYPLYNTWGCVFSVYPFPLWWLREYIYLSYYHHQIGSMNYCPLFRVRSWNNGVRCVSFCILILAFVYLELPRGGRLNIKMSRNRLIFNMGISNHVQISCCNHWYLSRLLLN